MQYNFKPLTIAFSAALQLFTLDSSLSTLHARDVIAPDGTNGVRIVSVPSFSRPTGGARCVRVVAGYDSASVFGSVPLVVEEWQSLSLPGMAAARRRYAKATVAEYGPGLYPLPATSPLPFGTSRNFGSETYVQLPHPADLPTNAVIAVTADVDGNGEYTPGEPYGVCMLPDGDSSRATVGLSLTHPSVFRIDLAEAVRANSFDAQQTMNDRGARIFGYGANKPIPEGGVGTNMPPATATGVKVHVICVAVNDVAKRQANNLTYYAGRKILTIEKNLAENKLLTEADILDAGFLDFDWGPLDSTYLSNLGLSVAGYTNMTYRLVIGDAPYQTSYATNGNNIATMFVNTFEATRTAAQALSPNGTIHAPPTFKWRHNNPIGKAYPAFQLTILKPGGSQTLATTGPLRAPVRAADGTYSWQWPVDLSIPTNGVLLCGVRNERGGTVTTADRYLLGVTNYEWRVSMLDAKFTTPDTPTATGFFNAFTNLYPTAETTP